MNHLADHTLNPLLFFILIPLLFFILIHLFFLPLPNLNPLLFFVLIPLSFLSLLNSTSQVVTSLLPLLSGRSMIDFRFYHFFGIFLISRCLHFLEIQSSLVVVQQANRHTTMSVCTYGYAVSKITYFVLCMI
jgi:hypothetical protein